MEVTFHSVEELKEFLKTLPECVQISLTIEVEREGKENARKENPSDCRTA